MLAVTVDKQSQSPPVREAWAQDGLDKHSQTKSVLHLRNSHSRQTG